MVNKNTCGYIVSIYNAEKMKFIHTRYNADCIQYQISPTILLPERFQTSDVQLSGNILLCNTKGRNYIKRKKYSYIQR